MSRLVPPRLPTYPVGMSKLYDLTEKAAVVTGASRGIGRHIAQSLHDAGMHVAITARREDALQQTASEIGQRCRAYVCDQRDPDAVRRTASRVVDDLGGPDILVANAASFGGGPVKDLPLATWNDVIQTNLTGTFLTVQAFLPVMLEKERGDIFLISSMSGKKGDPNGSAYAASKFGLQGFAQSLTYELRRDDIRVMVLNPSGVNTEPEDDGPLHGPGLRLHAADLAATIVHLARLPGRTLIRDMDIWGTNPF